MEDKIEKPSNIQRKNVLILKIQRKNSQASGRNKITSYQQRNKNWWRVIQFIRETIQFKLETLHKSQGAAELGNFRIKVKGVMLK